MPGGSEGHIVTEESNNGPNGTPMTVIVGADFR
jgi:hypothetical protein